MVLEAKERAGLGHDPMLDSVRIPEGFEYLWATFFEILGGVEVGFSGMSITWPDLDAYERVTGLRLDSFEVAALMAMSGALRTS